MINESHIMNIYIHTCGQDKYLTPMHISLARQEFLLWNGPQIQPESTYILNDSTLSDMSLLQGSQPYRTDD